MIYVRYLIDRGDTLPQSPVSPPTSYGSQVTAQLHDNYSPNVRVQYVQQNHAPATHTTLPDGSTRIQIQRSAPEPPLPPTPRGYGGDSGMPDYTIPYQASSGVPSGGGGGGPYAGGDLYAQNSYNVGSSMSLPRGVGYSGDRGGQQTQEPRSVKISFTSHPQRQPPIQPQTQSQQIKFNPTQAYESRIGSRYADPLEETDWFPSSSASVPFSPTSGGLRTQQPSSVPSYTTVNVSSPYSAEPVRPTVNSYSSSPYSQSSGPQPSPMSPTGAYRPQPSFQVNTHHSSGLVSVTKLKKEKTNDTSLFTRVTD